MSDNSNVKIQAFDFAPRHRRAVPPPRKPFKRLLGLSLLVLIFTAGLMAFSTDEAGRTEPDIAVDSLTEEKVGTIAPAASNLKPLPVDARLDLEAPFRNYPLPDTFRHSERNWIAHYSHDSLLQSRMELYLRRHRPEHGVLLACDLSTGRLLGLAERADSLVSSRPALAFGKSFPAASLAKIITSIAAMEYGDLSPEDSIPQPGAYHTLYWRQLRADRATAAHISLSRAFAYSANPAFALLGMDITPEKLRATGARLGFNAPRTPRRMSISRFSVPDSGFALAEVSCGFTHHTTISPLHALELMRALGHDGHLKPLLYADSLVQWPEATQPTIMPTAESGVRMLEARNLERMRSLMQTTVYQGTARKGFYSILQRSHLDLLDLGGKTGSLDGFNPEGRYDWFVGYGNLRDDPSRGIAICVMLVHTNYQSLRATKMGALLIREWLRQELNRPKTEPSPA